MRRFKELTTTGKIGAGCAILLGITISLAITAVLLVVLVIQGRAIPDLILLTF